MSLLTAPSVMLRWATAVVSGARVEPNSGQKDSGFVDGEAPPAAVHNWLWGIAGDWIAYLAQQASRSALLDARNFFTVGPLEVDVSDASVALLQTVMHAARDAHSGNRWKLLASFTITSTDALDPNPATAVLVYSGRDAPASDSSAPGALCISLNARWDVPTQTWNPLTATTEPMALIFSARGIRVSQQAAPTFGGPGTWASWPAGTRMDAAPNGSIASVGEYTYVTTPTRHKTRNVHDYVIASGSWSINLAGALQAANAGDEALFPLDLPHGCTVKFYVQVTQANTAPMVLQVYQRRKTDWPATATPTQTIAQDITTATMTYTGPTSAGVDMLITGQLVIDNANCSYDLSVVAGHAGDLVDDIWFEIADPGPRNF